jgi:hypothetical protein
MPLFRGRLLSKQDVPEKERKHGQSKISSSTHKTSVYVENLTSLVLIKDWCY